MNLDANLSCISASSHLKESKQRDVHLKIVVCCCFFAFVCVCVWGGGGGGLSAYFIKNNFLKNSGSKQVSISSFPLLVSP